MKNKPCKFSGPIVNARYIRNRSKAGRPITKQSDQAVAYVGYGHTFENPEQQLRGQWYRPEGADTHKAVAAWSHEQAVTHQYTYTLIVSVRDGQMQDGDFLAALQAENSGDAHTEATAYLPTDWRLMVHRDSNHDHAHVLFFRDKTLRKGELAQLRQHIQQVLLVREQQRLREAVQEQGVAYDL